MTQGNQGLEPTRNHVRGIFIPIEAEAARLRPVVGTNNTTQAGRTVGNDKWLR